MEKTQKKNMRGCRINSLQNTILLHVLSFLDMRQVVSTSRISRKWRYLWIHLRTLNFNHTLWNGQGQAQKFTTFVEKVFLLRGASSVNEFNLICSFANNMPNFANMDTLNIWLTAAARKRIPQVSFTVSVYKGITELTPLIFSSAVEVMDIISPLITNPASPKCSIQLPNAICSAPNLKTLNLNSIRLPKGDSKREVTLKCHVLENLTLEGCYYAHLISFNISIPKLKILTVKNVAGEPVKSVGSCKIRISTPNLTTLWLKCCSFKNYVIVNCDSLVSAKVEFSCGTLLGDEGKISLGCLQNATKLDLSDWTLEICLEFQDMLDQMPDMFCNLRSLKLVKWHQPCCIRALASLLSRSINIEYLVFEFIQGNSNTTISVEDLEKLFSFQCSFHHLKSVELLNFTGCQIEMKLLESVLKNAIGMEELTVIAHPSRNTRQGLKEYMDKIQALPRASSRATILVLRS